MSNILIDVKKEPKYTGGVCRGTRKSSKLSSQKYKDQAYPGKNK